MQINNKHSRKVRGSFKYKKRLRLYGLESSNKLRNTSKPCSCAMCSPAKVEEKAKYRLNKFDNKNYF